MKCGFVTQRSSYDAWTPELLGRIKSYGFGSILIEHWMGRIQNQDGSYNEAKLANGLKLFKMVKAAGLEPVIDLRVHYYPDMRNYETGYTTWTDGNPQAEWIVLTDEGKEKFIDCWKKLIANYKPSKISLWHFPGHNGGFANARDAYMTSWGEEVVSRIREFFKGEIIFTLPYQGSSESRGRKSYYLEIYDPFTNVENVTYGVGHMLDWDIVSNPSAEWNNDLLKLENDFAGIKKYHDLGEKVASIEFGGLEYNVGEKPLQSRLDYLRAVSEKMKSYNTTYTYHCCRPQGSYAGRDNIIENLTTKALQPDILGVLRENIFEPSGAVEGDNRFLLPLFLLFMFFGIVLMFGSTSGRQS